MGLLQLQFSINFVAQNEIVLNWHLNLYISYILEIRSKIIVQSFVV